MNIDALTTYLALSSGSYSGILRDMYAVHNLGLNPDLHTKLLANRFVGVTKELSGIPPLSFTAKGKPLTAWSITGNTVQNGTPTPDTPQEVKAVGDRTANLFDYKKYFESTFTKYSEYFEWAEIQLKPFTTYTFATSFSESTTATGVINTAFIITSSAEEPKTLTGGISSTRISTKTTEADGIIKIYKRIRGIYLPKKEDFDSGMYWLMINEGDTALPYEPYGYKIPIVTRGKNLAGNYTVSSGYYYDDSGTPTPSDARFIRLTINVEPNTIYTISSNLKFYSIWEFNNNTKISRRGGGSSNKYTIKTAKECNSLRISMINTSGEADTSAFEWIQLEEGTTATPYEPYHEPITTPIYLPTPLYSGEVIRSDGTITRSDGTTETFTAPQIPTLNGTTVIDVDTAVKPESMTIKYRR